MRTFGGANWYWDPEWWLGVFAQKRRLTTANAAPPASAAAPEEQRQRSGGRDRDRLRWWAGGCDLRVKYIDFIICKQRQRIFPETQVRLGAFMKFGLGWSCSIGMINWEWWTWIHLMVDFRGWVCVWEKRGKRLAKHNNLIEDRSIDQWSQIERRASSLESDLL